jgi:hypothetical protein
MIEKIVIVQAPADYGAGARVVSVVVVTLVPFGAVVVRVRVAV